MGSGRVEDPKPYLGPERPTFLRTYIYIYIYNIYIYIYNIYIYIETAIRHPKKVGLFGYRKTLNR